MKYEFKRIPNFQLFEPGPNFVRGKLYPTIDITSLKDVNIVEINKYLKREVGWGHFLTHDWNLYFSSEDYVIPFIIEFAR